MFRRLHTNAKHLSYFVKSSQTLPYALKLSSVFQQPNLRFVLSKQPLMFFTKMPLIKRGFSTMREKSHIALPDNWHSATDVDGSVYYRNHVTGEIQRERPLIMEEQIIKFEQSPDLSAMLPVNWHSATDRSGRVYYYNPITGQSQWDRPNTIEDQLLRVKKDMDLIELTQMFLHLSIMFLIMTMSYISVIV